MKQTTKSAQSKSGSESGLPEETSEVKIEEYRPGSASIPDQFLPNPNFIKVLDQGQEGAAVGHGMAAMINYLLRERGISEQVSVRMLQQLSKQYDGGALDVDHGSTLHNGMKVWDEKGVCAATLWPYGPVDQRARTVAR